MLSGIAGDGRVCDGSVAIAAVYASAFAYNCIIAGDGRVCDGNVAIAAVYAAPVPVACIAGDGRVFYCDAATAVYASAFTRCVSASYRYAI